MVSFTILFSSRFSVSIQSDTVHLVFQTVFVLFSIFPMKQEEFLVLLTTVCRGRFSASEVKCAK